MLYKIIISISSIYMTDMDEIDMYFKQLEEYKEPADITIDINDFGRKKAKERETHKHSYIYDRSYGCSVCRTCGLASEPDFVVEKRTPYNPKPCRRIQHLTNILNNVQHRFKPDIDDVALQAIKTNLSRFQAVKYTDYQVHQALKALGMTGRYKHINSIVSLVNDEPNNPTVISREEERRIILEFRKISMLYNSSIGNKRVSFFNYKFILNRICARLGYKHLLKYFTTPKNITIVRSQDDIFERIMMKF